MRESILSTWDISLADRIKQKKLGKTFFAIVFLYVLVAINPDIRRISVIWYTINAIMILYSVFLGTNYKCIFLTKYIIWYVIFYVICVASLFYSQSFDTGFDSIKTLSLLLLSVGSLSIVITSTEEINKLIKCMLIAFIVNAIYIFIAIDLNEILLAGQRVGAENINEYWNANSIGIFSALGSMLSLYFVQKQNNKIINIVLFLSFIMFTILCLLSGSRKGLLLFIMLNGLFLFLLTKNKLIISLVILLSVSILYYLLMNIDILYNIIGKRMQNMIEGFFGLGTSESSFNIRQDMIEKGFQFFSQKPILGYGINNFRNLYDINTYAHNNFIELLVGIGLVGFTVYYIAYAYVLCKLFKTTFIKPNRLSIIAFVINTCFLISHYAFVGYYEIINTLTILLGFLIIQLNKGTAHEKNFKQSNKRY